jgi:S1-C subfamily serine protease
VIRAAATTFRATALALAAAAMIVIPARADDTAAEARRRERLLSVGIQRVALDPQRRSQFEPTAQGFVWSDRIEHTGNSPIAVHLLAAAFGDQAGWTVRVLDRNGAQADELRGDSPCWRAAGCWTMLVPRAEANVQLWTSAPGNGVEIVIDAYQYATIPSEVEGTVGRDDKKDVIAASARAQKFAPPIARLVVLSQRAYCTGFLVAPDLLLTNQHCIADDADALSTTAEFRYQKPFASPERRFRVAKLEAVDRVLDYALVRLEGNAGSSYGRLRVEPAVTIANGAHLLVIQHPNGMPKMIAEDDCTVSGLGIRGAGSTNTDFGHTCDTLRGSSGAPVISDGDRVIGLHHWGFDENDKPLNQAVQIDLILKDIRDVQHRPAVADEILAP